MRVLIGWKGRKNVENNIMVWLNESNMDMVIWFEEGEGIFIDLAK